MRVTRLAISRCRSAFPIACINQACPIHLVATFAPSGDAVLQEHAPKAHVDGPLREPRRPRDHGRPPRRLVDLAPRDRRATTREEVSVLDGLKARLDEELAEDRAFLAKMKPALIKA